MSDTEKRPKRGFLRLLIVGLIVLAAVLVANLTSPDRYSLQGTGTEMFKMDKSTGKTWRSKVPKGSNADRRYEIQHFE